MTLRPEYSLGNSPYNDFLFASVGQDASGTELTVLSALIRLDIDPWLEAACLADLPRDAAARAVAATMARLPDIATTGKWKDAMATEIAQRLVATLPGKSAPVVPSTPEVRSTAAASVAATVAGAPARWLARASIPTWLIWGALAMAFYFLIVQMTPNQNLEPAERETTTQQ